jgi:serine/threonine protein kinase
MPLPQGTQLGPYTIIALLGQGGMGVVYRARDERLQRDVAIKVLPPGLLSDEPAKGRFRKEALALARLSHPNIAAVFDVGEQDGMDYLVMECVPGQTLSQKMRSQELPAKEILSLGVQVAGALEEAHEQGVVHRDLKPSNIMVTPKGHAKVLDFGLAKLLEPVGTPEVTLSLADTHGPVGTALYMSPEQAAGKFVDSRTDLWSFGVVLYEALAGKPPFQGASALAILRAVSTEDPKPLRDIRPETPEGADQIVSHALKKDLSERYQSASEISRDLSDVLLQLSASLPLADRASRFSPRILLTAIVLLLLPVGSVMWLYQRSERRHWAREEAIPAIAKLKSEEKSLAAFLLLKKAEQYLPDDPQLARLAEQNTTHVSVTSSPARATVEIQDYLSPDGAWYRLGTTPLTGVQIPSGYFRWKVSKAGIGESVAAPTTEKNVQFDLDSTVAAPQGMSWVGGGSWIGMIAFVGWVGPYNVLPYYIDRLEVTNRQYQEFVDKGGYEKQEYWPKQFLHDGRELTWQDAKAQRVAIIREDRGTIQCRELAGTRRLPTRRSRARACPPLSSGTLRLRPMWPGISSMKATFPNPVRRPLAPLKGWDRSAHTIWPGTCASGSKTLPLQALISYSVEPGSLRLIFTTTRRRSQPGIARPQMVSGASGT